MQNFFVLTGVSFDSACLFVYNIRYYTFYFGTMRAAKAGNCPSARMQKGAMR